MAIAVDASSPPLVFAVDLSAATTNPFNPPANSVLVACVGANHYGTSTYNGANWTISNNGAALTWSLAVKRNNQDKGASSADGAIYVAPLSGARTGMTVTATVAAVSGTSDSTFLGLYVVTGGDLASIVGAIQGGFSTSNVVTTTAMTAVGDNSLLFCMAVDYSAAGAPTSSDLTIQTGHQASGISFLTGYKSMGSAGSSNSANIDAPGTASVNWSPWITAEIKAGTTGPPGTVTHVATSPVVNAGVTTTAGTTAVTPTLPTGTANGDRVFILQAGNNTAGTTPTNWTALYKDVQVGPTGTAPGAGTGRRYISCYYRDYDGSWTMPSVSLTSRTQNTNSAAATTLRKGASDAWNSPTFSSPGNTASAVTAYSVTIPSFTTTDSGMLLSHTATNDNVTSSGQSLSQTGATFANNTERADGGSATGWDVSIKVGTVDVTTGATGTLSRTCTLSAASEGGTALVQQTSTGPAITVFQGATSLSATPTLTVNASPPIKVGAVSFSAGVSLTSAGVVSKIGAAALNASATLAAQPTPIVGAVALSAGSSLTSAGVVVKAGATALLATATLASDGVRYTSGAVSLASIPVLTTAGTVTSTQQGAVTLSAIPVLSTTAGQTEFAAVALTAVSVLSALAKLNEFAGVSLTANSTLTAQPTPIVGAVSLSVVSVLASVATVNFVGSTTLLAVVTFGKSATLGAFGAVSLSAGKTLVVGALLPGGAVSLPVTSSLAAAAILGAFGAVSLPAITTLTAAVGTRTTSGAVLLTATTVLGPAAFLAEFSTVALTVSTTLTATPIPTGAGATLAQATTLVVAATVIAGAGSLLTATAVLSVAGTRTTFGNVLLTVVPVLTTTVSVRVTNGTVGLSILAGLIASVGGIAGAVALPASYGLSVNGVRWKVGATSLLSVQTLSLSGVLGAFGVAQLSILPGLTLNGVTFKVASVTLTAVSVFISDSFRLAVGSISLIATYTLLYVELFSEVDFAEDNARWSVVGPGIRPGVRASEINREKGIHVVQHPQPLAGIARGWSTAGIHTAST